MQIRKLQAGENPPLELLLEADPQKELVEEYLFRGECFIAEIDGKVAGVYVLLPTRPSTIELVNIAIAEEEQGKGYGKKLIADAIQKAKEKKCRIMEVGTGNSSIGQLAMYQKCGFRITGVDKDFFVKHYSEPIVENGIPCTDMIRLSIDLG
ncbi:putative N-acetyltransferase YvbK [Virgibacillus pantothenticus]|uniref:Acetyltransferase n=1 Tax=Virgibacillus pantothenticus TaxID=1473 RepID=A0A0L0QV19_VIRPA|nr:MULTISPECIES: GNAT family N-acetyltransferase [Virgibacillus]API92606.1 GNAT family N-acetyltransferase [Virgibacillus sp. 6R]KNE22382.1 acetyltransferase [Virgibacillus pantothenticus]MBS7428096.1 GNAT family N-acetyltransferase [Virgibacillus sp. 19R1-5]MBU8565392.1 GNAT family N-acetyltransferase [Virgibacillus pantothenticus]MBU8599389.1 GNAT family N-acetyltransferase [Virgibacillus pantothenticus]